MFEDYVIVVDVIYYFYFQFDLQFSEFFFLVFGGVIGIQLCIENDFN